MQRTTQLKVARPFSFGSRQEESRRTRRALLLLGVRLGLLLFPSLSAAACSSICAGEALQT